MMCEVMHQERGESVDRPAGLGGHQRYVLIGSASTEPPPLSPRHKLQATDCTIQ